MTRLLLIAFLLACASGTRAAADDYALGNEVTFMERKKSDGSELGIPRHSTVGVSSMVGRFASGSAAKITELGQEPHRHWIKVKNAADDEGWVLKKYVDSVAAPTVDGGSTESPTEYVIGCWNLEHFKGSKTRGFPENTRGGPSFPARTDAQIVEIANTITQNLRAQFLVLSEIGGKTGTDADGDEIPLSDELDALVRKLPDGWDYTIAWSGHSQRIALLYNTKTMRVNEVQEFVVNPRRIQGKDIFDRDPLAAHVTFMDGTSAKNDLVIIGVHLASGQRNNRNHDEAMRVLRERLEASQQAGELGGTGEHDILIMGDYNANMFRGPAENFFIDMDAPASNVWDVLAGDGYPATRLSGVPLGFRTSQIDYIIASRFVSGGRNGLVGQEVTALVATVHTNLVTLQGGADSFRRDLSDHLPVTVAVTVVADDD